MTSRFGGGGPSGGLPPGSPPDFMDLIAPQEDRGLLGPVTNPSGVPNPQAVMENGHRKVVLEPRNQNPVQPSPPVQAQPSPPVKEQPSIPGKDSNEPVFVDNNPAIIEPPKKKMTAAEIQRMKINAASEYYRYVFYCMFNHFS